MTDSNFENEMHTQEEWDNIERGIRKQKGKSNDKEMTYKDYKRRLAVREFKYNFDRLAKGVEKVRNNAYLNQVVGNAEIFAGSSKAQPATQPTSKGTQSTELDRLRKQKAKLKADIEKEKALGIKYDTALKMVSQ